MEVIGDGIVIDSPIVPSWARMQRREIAEVIDRKRNFRIGGFHVAACHYPRFQPGDKV